MRSVFFLSESTFACIQIVCENSQEFVACNVFSFSEKSIFSYIFIISLHWKLVVCAIYFTAIILLNAVFRQKTR